MSTLVFLINVDWFFASHFLHLAKEAIANGYRVILISEETRAGEMLRKAGLETIALPSARAGTRPLGMRASVNIVECALRRNPNAVLHGFGLFGVTVGTLATRHLPHVRCVYSITGRGYAAISREPAMLLLRRAAAAFNRWIADDEHTYWMVENKADIRCSGLLKASRQGRVAVVGGAGVDPQALPARPMTKYPPLRLGFVARLIWSKGLDVAVNAVALAREQGYNVTLTVAGELDVGNPRAFSDTELATFAALPGGKFVGKIEDIPGFWSEHHVAILPSRGGEGVPKTLLEAAACGRPILTTTVPGCEELARLTNGWAIPPNDVAATADAITEIIRDSDLEKRGKLARLEIERGYTQQQLWQRAHQWYGDASK